MPDDLPVGRVVLVGRITLDDWEALADPTRADATRTPRAADGGLVVDDVVDTRLAALDGDGSRGRGVLDALERPDLPAIAPLERAVHRYLMTAGWTETLAWCQENGIEFHAHGRTLALQISIDGLVKALACKPVHRQAGFRAEAAQQRRPCVTNG